MARNNQKQLAEFYRKQVLGTKVDSKFGSKTNLHKSAKDYSRVFKKSQQGGGG
jgi:hypothetical protein